MNRLKKIAAVSLLIAAALLNTAFTEVAFAAETFTDEPTAQSEPTEEAAPRFNADELAFMKKLNGRWRGNFRVVTGVTKEAKEDGTVTTRQYYNDGVTMDFVYDAKEPKLFLHVESCPARYLLPREWHIAENDTLVFTFNDKPWQAVVTLKLGDGQLLTGTYRQKEQNMTMSMRRLLAEPVDFTGTPQFEFENEPDSVWEERLTGAPSYSEKGAGIAYKYELGINAKNKSLDTMFGLTKLMKGKTDIQKMTELLNLVCDNFAHNGSSGMPEKTDALSCISYARTTGGIECRGLSSILAELCRMAGIPAKPVMCIPWNDPCEDCHVVVQAYSQSLGQWVMLDPTYRLILRDKQGRYMNLETLRTALVNGTEVVANDNAGRNGSPFYMEYYRAYMTKNMFRFSSLTEFSFDAAGKEGNKENMLLPLGYTIPFLPYRTERLTTSASEFWAIPTGMPPPAPPKQSAPADVPASSGAQAGEDAQGTEDKQP